MSTSFLYLYPRKKRSERASFLDHCGGVMMGKYPIVECIHFSHHPQVVAHDHRYPAFAESSNVTKLPHDPDRDQSQRHTGDTGTPSSTSRSSFACYGVMRFEQRRILRWHLRPLQPSVGSSTC